MELEDQVGYLKKFWHTIKRLKIRQTKNKCNLLDVMDEEGNVKKGRKL